MSVLDHKIDFVVLATVNNANPNGDPLDGNRPRTDYRGYGEISDVCIKRKIRNRMIDMGYPVFVQSDDKTTDEYKSLSERASAELTKTEDPDAYAKEACGKWLDVRSFGQVFAFKMGNVSVGVRGPVTVHQAVSISPVEVNSMQITKSVNNEPAKTKSPDTIGSKHFIRFGLYEIKGYVNVQLAEKTGFTNEDAGIIKECLRTLFVNDCSSARPEGSMEVRRLYWWEHNCPAGQYSSAAVHRLVKITPKKTLPMCFEDYDIEVESREGLSCECIEGM